MEKIGGFCICGDEQYAEVNSKWLADYYDDYRKTLFDQGVTKWDAKFDCDHFAGFYVALAKIRFFTETFHTVTTAKAPALAEYWYRKEEGEGGGGHAVVVALTEQGTWFIEPQTGERLFLSTDEQNSKYLVKF